MKTYVHARLTKEERAILENLKRATGKSESELVRQGLTLLSKEHIKTPTALAAAGQSVGKFKKGPRDLSTNKKHLDDFGK